MRGGIEGGRKEGEGAYIQNGDVDENVFAPVDCGLDSVLEDVLERGKAGNEDLVVEVVRV